MVEGSCTFCIGTEKEITKFKWYGNPEGTFEMDDQKITLYKKSKVVKQAFGLIGSAMSGKGKYEAEITKEQIVGYKHDKKGSFWIDLNDSNKFYFCITGLGKKDKYDLVEKFLSEAVKMPGKAVANTNTVNSAPETPAPANTGVNAVPPTQQAYTQQPVPPQPVYTNPAPSPQPTYTKPVQPQQSAYTNPVPSSQLAYTKSAASPQHTYVNASAAPHQSYTNQAVQPTQPVYTKPPVQSQPVYAKPVQQPAYQNVSVPQSQSNQASSKLKFSASYRTIPAHTENSGGNMAMNQTTGTTSESFENIAQQLKMYKELLDSGLITEDDFNAKKKQLLNL